VCPMVGLARREASQLALVVPTMWPASSTQTTQDLHVQRAHCRPTAAPRLPPQVIERALRAGREVDLVTKPTGP